MNTLYSRRDCLKLATAALAGLRPLTAAAQSAVTGSRKPMRGAFMILTTPFTESGAVDWDDLVREVDFCDRSGVHGLVWPQGSSGVAHLTKDERMHGMEVAGEGGAGEEAGAGARRARSRCLRDAGIRAPRGSARARRDDRDAAKRRDVARRVHHVLPRAREGDRASGDRADDGRCAEPDAACGSHRRARARAAELRLREGRKQAARRTDESRDGGAAGDEGRLQRHVCDELAVRNASRHRRRHYRHGDVCRPHGATVGAARAPATPGAARRVQPVPADAQSRRQHSWRRPLRHAEARPLQDDRHPRRRRPSKADLLGRAGGGDRLPLRGAEAVSVAGCEHDRRRRRAAALTGIDADQERADASLPRPRPAARDSRSAAVDSRGGEGSGDLTISFHPQVRGCFRRDAAPVPDRGAAGAGEAAARAQRLLGDRCLHGGRVRESGQLQRSVRAPRRDRAVGLPAAGAVGHAGAGPAAARADAGLSHADGRRSRTFRAAAARVAGHTRRMRIKLTSIMVDDQAKALKFYTEVLGFVKKTEIPVGEYRWLTVVSPEGPNDLELSLEPNANPAGKTFQEAMFKQGIPMTAFEVDDIAAESKRLKGLGVVFTQEPTAAGPVTIAICADTCGNLIQLYQPPKPGGV